MYVFSNDVFHRQILNVCHGMYIEYETREKEFSNFVHWFIVVVTVVAI